MAECAQYDFNNDPEVGTVQVVSFEPHKTLSCRTRAWRACTNAYRECRFVYDGVFGLRQTPTGGACCSCLRDCTEVCCIVAQAVALLPLAAIVGVIGLLVISVVSAAQGFAMTAVFSGCAFALEPTQCTIDVARRAVATNACQVRINETHYGPAPSEDRVMDVLLSITKKDTSPQKINDCHVDAMMGMAAVTILFDGVLGISVYLLWALGPCCWFFVRDLYGDIQAQRAQWRRLDE